MPSRLQNLQLLMTKSESTIYLIMSTATNPATKERFHELFSLLYEKRKEDLRPDSIIHTLTWKGVSQDEAKAFQTSLRTNPEEYCPSLALAISSLDWKSDNTAIKECFAYICTRAYPDPEFNFHNSHYQLEWPPNCWTWWVQGLKDIEGLPIFVLQTVDGKGIKAFLVGQVMVQYRTIFGSDWDETGFMVVWDLDSARYLLAIAPWQRDEDTDEYMPISKSKKWATSKKWAKTFSGTNIEFSIAEISGLLGEEGIDIKPLSLERFSLKSVE
jgi:hypothetical protein